MMKARYLVYAPAGKSAPWGRALRRLVLGANTHVLPWVETVRGVLKFPVSYYDVLRVIATHMGPDTWDDMRLCIDWITERVSWSRRTVERALAFFRSAFVLRQDGELHVRRGRPVVRYRLGSTPECPLPWDVVEARETAGQRGSGVYNSSTGPSVLVEDQGETPGSSSISPTAGVSNYRPASPVKTGPHVDRSVRGGSVRRPSHLRWLRSVAESVVARAGGAQASAGRKASQEPAGAVVAGYGRWRGKPVVVASGAAVTYCHPPTRGAAVHPFNEPVFGKLSRDTRLLYLGLREAHTRGERTFADTLFLKSQFFPYDWDIDAPYLQSLVDNLVTAGKAHIVDGDIILSDPPTNTKEIALLAAPPKRTRAKALVEDPWFAAFWDAYPRRTGKGAARKAFASAVAAGTDPQVIVATASAYAARCELLQKEPQFIPHPATWLNQERWEDDEEQAPRVRSRVDDAARSGLDLVSFYQQQDAIPFDDKPQLEIEW